jgi:hypothetical protein
MMAPPVDVAGPRPRLGDVEAPPRSRSSPSSVAEAESEPLGRARRSSSSSGAEPKSEPWVGRSGVRRLPGLARVRALGRAERSSPSSGAWPESEPWVGRSGVRRLPGLSPSPSPGSGGAELPMVCGRADCLSASLCQVAPQSEGRRRHCLSDRPVSGAAK